MATVADLKSQIGTALGALSTAFPVLDSGTLDSQRVQREEYRAMIRINGVETTTIGSNLTVTIATTEVDLLHRAADATPGDLESAEDALALLVDDVAAEAFWSGLAAVRSSPIDVTVESDLERVGEVVRYTIRADCALEG